MFYSLTDNTRRENEVCLNIFHSSQWKVWTLILDKQKHSNQKQNRNLNRHVLHYTDSFCRGSAWRCCLQLEQDCETVHTSKKKEEFLIKCVSLHLALTRHRWAHTSAGEKRGNSALMTHLSACKLVLNVWLWYLQKHSKAEQGDISTWACCG